MTILHRATCLLVVGCLVACGSSSSSPPQDEAAVASFAGQGNLPTEKACTQDSDCDNHDPCTTFVCKRDSGEIATGRCVYTLGDGKSCGGSTDAGTDGPIGVVVAPLDASTPDSAGVDSGVGPNACTKGLSVKLTTPNTGVCSYNSTVEASSPATLSYACDGGNASVTFGAQTFSGTETNGSVSVTNVSTYSFTNLKYKTTCQYKSTQTISGSLASGKLSYSYTEVLDANQPALCPFVTAPCSASGDVTVQ